MNRNEAMLVLKLDEGDRQLILLALAHLAIERPGWRYATSLIAAKLDVMVEGKPLLYTRFFTMRQEQVTNSLPESPTDESLKTALSKHWVVKPQPKETHEPTEARRLDG